MFLDQRADQALVSSVAHDQHRLRRYRPAVAGGKIVEHDDTIPGTNELPHGM